MDNQDSSMSLRKVDAELARARDLRDVRGVSWHFRVVLTPSGMDYTKICWTRRTRDA